MAQERPASEPTPRSQKFARLGWPSCAPRKFCEIPLYVQYVLALEGARMTTAKDVAQWMFRAHTIKTFAPFSAAFAILVGIVLVGRAFAGPLEEADAADKRAEYATALRLISPLAQQGDAGAQRRLGIM